MFKFSFKLCFISLILLFNISNISLLIAQDGDTADSQKIDPKVQGDSSSINSEEDTANLEDNNNALESLAEGDAAEEEAAQAQKEKSVKMSEGEVGAEELEGLGKIGVVEEPVEQNLEKTIEQKKEVVEAKQETESTVEPQERAQTQPVVEPEEAGQPVEIEAVELVRTQGSEVLDKIELQEQGASIVKTDDLAKKLKEFLQQTKSIGKDINNIADRLRKARNELHAKYQNDVDKKLDELLQKMGFDSGEATGKDRFKLLHRAVKSEYENEWEQIKKEINEIDSLENQVFEKLKVVDDKYENVVQISIESRKLNLEVFNVSDVSKLEDVLNKLQTKQQAVKKTEEEITNILEKEFTLLITQIIEKFKKVDNDFKELEKKGSDLDAYENALEKAKEEKRNQLPKWRQVIENVVDRILDYSSMILGKAKYFWNSFYSKISIFILDVKEKSQSTKEKSKAFEDGKK